MENLPLQKPHRLLIGLAASENERKRLDLTVVVARVERFERLHNIVDSTPQGWHSARELSRQLMVCNCLGLAVMMGSFDSFLDIVDSLLHVGLLDCSCHIAVQGSGRLGGENKRHSRGCRTANNYYELVHMLEKGVAGGLLGGNIVHHEADNQNQCGGIVEVGSKFQVAVEDSVDTA